MKEINEMLNKMLNDANSLNNKKDELLKKTMSDIDRLGENKHSNFLKKSLEKANNGDLDIYSFLENVKNMDNEC